MKRLHGKSLVDFAAITIGKKHIKNDVELSEEYKKEH